jgi:hypothetical protein
MRSQEMSIVGLLMGVDPFKSASHNVRIAFADDGDDLTRTRRERLTRTLGRVRQIGGRPAPKKVD